MQPNDSHLWQLVDRLRATGAHLSVAEVVQACADNEIAIAPSQLWSLGARLGAQFSMESLCPPSVATFIADLVSPHLNGTVLDPFAGFGALLQPVVAATKPARVLAAHPNAEIVGAAKLLCRAEHIAYEWESGGVLDAGGGDLDVDVAVSAPPLGGRKRQLSIRGVELNDHEGHCVLVQSVARLRPSGVGVFLVAPSFLIRKCAARNALSELGLHVDAWFHVPSGTLAPLTHIETGIVVVRRGPSPETIFVAAMAEDAAARAALLERYRKRASHPEPALGALVPFDDFDGLPRLIARRRMEAHDRKPHLRRVRLGDIALAIRRCATDVNEVAPAENVFFLPLATAGAPRLELQDLPRNPREFVQIVLDPSKALARTVAEFLNSNAGRDVRAAHAVGVTVPRLPMSSVAELPVWLPSLADQHATLELDQRLTAMSEQLRELRGQLWTDLRPSAVAPHLERLHREESFTDWLDSLPFPLASVLWSYHVAKGDPAKQYQRLDYFFEAVTAFLAILVLSAARRDEALFAERWPNARAALSRINLSIERPSLGVWRLILESLAKPIRSALGRSETREHWCNIFAIDDEDLLHALVSTRMMQLLGKANERRNTWRGHGGATGESVAALRHSEMVQLLNDFRRLVGRRWGAYPLVWPASMRLTGGVYHTGVELVMGSRYPFQQEKLLLNAPCDSDHLHAVSRRRGLTMRLLPFVRLGPSPEQERNACYFFNRVDREHGLRFVSYHFEAKPELSMSDAAVARALVELGGA